MNIKPLKILSENSIASDIDIVCKQTKERKRWNDAARAGWVCDWDGAPFNAYYSPEGLAQRKAMGDSPASN